MQPYINTCGRLPPEFRCCQLAQRLPPSDCGAHFRTRRFNSRFHSAFCQQTNKPPRKVQPYATVYKYVRPPVSRVPLLSIGTAPTAQRLRCSFPYATIQLPFFTPSFANKPTSHHARCNCYATVYKYVRPHVSRVPVLSIGTAPTAQRLRCSFPYAAVRIPLLPAFANKPTDTTNKPPQIPRVRPHHTKLDARVGRGSFLIGVLYLILPIRAHHRQLQPFTAV